MAQIAKLLKWHQMMPFCRERPENGKGLKASKKNLGAN
jgi:hypothetical protein